MNWMELVAELAKFVFDALVAYLNTPQGQAEIEQIIATVEGGHTQTGQSSGTDVPTNVADVLASWAKKNQKS